MTRRHLYTVLREISTFYGDYSQPWQKHCRNVAIISKRIASHIYKCDSDFAMLYGLVHDLGRSTERSQLDARYHCVDGYLILEELEQRTESVFVASIYRQLKYSPLTHSFPSLKDLTLVPGYYNPLWDKSVKNKEDIKIVGIWDTFIPQKLEGYSPNVYDTIVCLADLMSFSDKTVTIERRLEEVALKYGHTHKIAETLSAIQSDVDYIECLTGKPLEELTKEN